jgi:hypothetical protein
MLIAKECIMLAKEFLQTFIHIHTTFRNRNSVEECGGGGRIMKILAKHKKAFLS